MKIADAKARNMLFDALFWKYKVSHTQTNKYKRKTSGKEKRKISVMFCRKLCFSLHYVNESKVNAQHPDIGHFEMPTAPP